MGREFKLHSNVKMCKILSSFVAASSKKFPEMQHKFFEFVFGENVFQKSKQVGTTTATADKNSLSKKYSQQRVEVAA